MQSVADFLIAVDENHWVLISAFFEAGTWPGADEWRAAPDGEQLGVLWTAQLQVVALILDADPLYKNTYRKWRKGWLQRHS